MYKQNGNLNNVLVGGEPSKIYPLWLSLYNWNGLSEELRDLGNPEVFQFFNIDKNKYIKHRAYAFANNCDKFFGKTRNGKLVWKLAQNKARLELESFKEEKFLMGRDLEFEEFRQLSN